MSSALDAFRAQKEAVEQIHARLTDMSDLLRTINGQVEAIAANPTLHRFVSDETNLLEQTQRTLRELRAFREEERRRFWPGVWRRWAVALVFALASAAACGAGYVWAAGPHEAELAALRARAELLDYVAQRVIKMTPSERSEFDALMKWNDRSKR
ncbi:MAG TPA: hypothetical protein VJN96_00265 [Vicinamibacterales bacterium]|nr:hypothetical protein [Vicinamibacterales bacterium]